VYLVDPNLLSRAANLMRSGSVSSTRFQIYHAHLGFILQFMIDFGLYGCSWVDIETSKLRTEQPSAFANGEPTPAKVSRLQLEVDVMSPHIINRRYLKERDIHHITNPWPEQDSQDSLIQSIRELWDEERHRRVSNGLASDMQRASDNKSKRSQAPWNFEEEYWEKLAARIDDDEGDPPDPLPIDRWEGWIQTAFKSTECLWHHESQSWQPETKSGVRLSQQDNPYSQILDPNSAPEEGSTVSFEEIVLPDDLGAFDEHGEDETDQRHEDTVNEREDSLPADEEYVISSWFSSIDINMNLSDFFQLKVGDEDLRMTEEPDAQMRGLDELEAFVPRCPNCAIAYLFAASRMKRVSALVMNVESKGACINIVHARTLMWSQPSQPLAATPPYVVFILLYQRLHNLAESH
jgi:DNA polymerase zeta